MAKLTGKNKVITNEEIGLKFDGLPTSIEWGPFFKSGLLELDEEHHELILASNEIIYHCFDASNTSYMIRLFKKLIEAIVVHFENEEKILESYAYSKLNEHKICHEDLKKKALILLEGLIKSQFTAVHVAQYLIQDVVVGHLIKSDFEFFELFSKPKQ